MAILTIDELKNLRTEVVSAIADSPELITADTALDYASILELVRATGRTDLLKVALEKVHQIEESSIKATAMIEVLDAIETEISLQTSVEQDQSAQATEAPRQDQHNEAENHQYDNNQG